MIKNKYTIHLLIIALNIFLGASCLKPKKKIIFFGDSITELAEKPGGYIQLLRKKFEEYQLSGNVELTGSGISANKVYDLYLRMEDDVLSKNPDIVVIWIGVNDVWHKKILGTGTDADKFERFYSAIITKLKEKKIAVTLCTPAVVGEKWDGTNELDKGIDQYSAIIKKVAKQNNCGLVNFRSEFITYLKQNNKKNDDKGWLTYDGVHLNNAGNEFVSSLLYNHLKPQLK